MRSYLYVVLAALLCALPAWADDVPPAAHPMHLLDDGSGDGAPGSWTDRWTPEGRTIGVGLQLGFPSAITIEGLVSDRTSFVAGVGAFGYRFFEPALSFYLDYLWHPFILAHPGSDLVLSWYVGVGGWLSFYENGYVFSGYSYGADSQAAIAVRVPLGLDLSLGRLPLMLYGEVVPTLLVFPDLDIGLGASIGVRLFF